MVVGQTLGVGLGAGGMAELHVGIFLGGLDHVVLMAEGVGKDDVAAGVRQVSGGLVALLTLGNIGLDDVVGDAQGLAGLLGAVDEVEVVGGVLIVQADKAHLHAGGGVAGAGSTAGARGLVVGVAAGGQAESHAQGQQQCKKLLHSDLSSFKYLGKMPNGGCEPAPPFYHTGSWIEIQLYFFIFFDFFHSPLCRFFWEPPGSGLSPLPF